MHPKIQERRGAVLSAHLSEIDRNIETACALLAHRVRLAGQLCLGEDGARQLERQFRLAVDYVVAIPAVSEEGRVARRDLIRKLGELEDYLATLFSAAWARQELDAGPDRGLDRLRQDASRLDDRRIADTDRAFVFSFK